MVNLFSFLLVGHLVGDFLFQTSWMALNKDKQFTPLLVHSLIYTVTVALFALPAEGLSIAAMALVFLGHLVIDRRLLVDFWLKNILRSPDLPWLKIVQDQVWHVLILAGAAML